MVKPIILINEEPLYRNRFLHAVLRKFLNMMVILVGDHKIRYFHKNSRKVFKFFFDLNLFPTFRIEL